MWFIGAEVEQETSAPPPKKNPGSAPDTSVELCFSSFVGYLDVLFTFFLMTFLCIKSARVKTVL